MNNLQKIPEVSSRIAELIAYFQAVRALSEKICEPLEIDDYGLQAMAETSPAKWHIAHTSWFFETFLLKPHLAGFKTLNTEYEVIFNSYYNGIGPQHPRAQRSLLSRPTLKEVMQYRKQVTEAICELLANVQLCSDEVIQKVILGCHHEQQHQELFFTDLKYCWYQNPLYPVYKQSTPGSLKATERVNKKTEWITVAEGLYDIGYQQEGSFPGFSFDNETPCHKHFLNETKISSALVTNAEYLQFVEDEGYLRSELWLSDAWAHLQNPASRHAPLYWVKKDSGWYEYTLQGLLPLNPEQPVSHVSAYEADAFARWKGCRLPTEFEWEVFANQVNPGCEGQFLESNDYHPTAEQHNKVMMGKLWQWTSSAYSPYPGYKAAAGAIGEYNGKFMCNQLVLRGASCVTSKNHYRHSYRNFFYPNDQWQFSGIRLASL